MNISKIKEGFFKRLEKYKWQIFVVLMAAAAVAEFFIKSEKEGIVPFAAFATSLGILLSAIAIDRYRHPEIYKDSKNK
jgi:uncharacterized membrane protein YhhN